MSKDAEAVFTEEAEKVWAQEGADDLSATPEKDDPEPEQTSQEDADATTEDRESETPVKDEWEGVPEVVRKRFTALEEDFKRREHGLKSELGRRTADLQRRLEAAQAAQPAKTVPEAETPEWDELNREFEPIAKGVQQYVERKLRDVQPAQQAHVNDEQAIRDNVSAITGVDVDELIAKPEFVDWYSRQPDDIRALGNAGGVKGGAKLVREYQKFQSEAEKALKLKQDREARLKNSTLPVGQSSSRETSDDSTLSPEQLWEIESRKTWKEKSA